MEKIGKQQCKYSASQEIPNNTLVPNANFLYLLKISENCQFL